MEYKDQHEKELSWRATQQIAGYLGLNWESSLTNIQRTLEAIVVLTRTNPDFKLDMIELCQMSTLPKE